MTSNDTARDGYRPNSANDSVASCLNLSHEMRTPANVILGHVELLLAGSAGPLTSEMRMSLGDIQRAAMGLSTQISEVIRLAEDLAAPGSRSADRR